MKQKTDNGERLFFSLTSVYLSIIMSAYLLYPGLGGYQEITVQKWRAYIFITGVYVLIMFLLRIELTIVGAEKLPTFKSVWHSLNLLHKLVLLYLCITAISTIISEYHETALWGSRRCEGFITIALYCLSFLLVSEFWKPKRWLLWVYAIAISINCVVCLMQFAGLNPLKLYPDGLNYYGANKKYAGEFLGTIGNVDILSAMLSLSIPGFFAAILRMKGYKKRFLLLIPMALCLAVLLKSFVAGGVLGVVGAVVLSVPFMMEGKTVRKKALIFVLVLIILVAFAVYFFGNDIGGFLYEASELMHGRWNDNYGSGRIYIWRNVIKLVPKRPILGGGPDTLGLRTDAAFERYDETLGILIRSDIDSAHNEYLNILVNQGAIALLLYLAALAASAIKWVRDGVKNPATAICGCAILGYCIQAFFGISSPISTPYLWLALAILNPCFKGSTLLKERGKKRK